MVLKQYTYTTVSISPLTYTLAGWTPVEELPVPNAYTNSFVVSMHTMGKRLDFRTPPPNFCSISN